MIKHFLTNTRKINWVYFSLNLASSVPVSVPVPIPKCPNSSSNAFKVGQGEECVFTRAEMEISTVLHKKPPYASDPC